MDTNKLRSRFKEAHRMLKVLDSKIDDSESDYYYTMAYDLLSSKLENSMDLFETLTSGDVADDELEDLVDGISKDLSSIKITAELLILALDEGLFPESTRDLVARMEDEDYELTSEQMAALEELKSLEESTGEFAMPSLPSNFEDDDDEEDDESMGTGLEDEGEDEYEGDEGDEGDEEMMGSITEDYEGDEDFEAHLKEVDDLSRKMSSRYGVPLNKVKEDLDGLLEEDDDLEAAEQSLHQMYRREPPPLPGVKKHFQEPQIAEASLLKELIKVADKLDKAGFHKEAEVIDIIITKVR
jgi:hypothetical protein